MTSTSSPSLGSSESTLRRLELQVTRRLDGLLQGDHLGLVPAPGSEPGEGREYQPGDDVRRIDWNLTARTGVPHVRDSIADRELETWVLVDRSPSLDFGTALHEKRDVALIAAAAIGFLTLRSANRVGAVVLAGDDGFVHPARSGRDAFMSLLHRLRTMPRADDTVAERGPKRVPATPVDEFAVGLGRLARVARRRGLVVVISDFLAPAGWERPLRALTERHDVLAIDVIDPRELELPNVGVLTLIDTETGRRIEVQTASEKLRARYAEAAAARTRRHR